MTRNAILGWLMLLVTPLATLNSNRGPNNNTATEIQPHVSLLETVVQKVKSFITYLGSFFPTFTSCNFNHQRVLYCYNNHQVLRCLPSNLGLVTNCIGDFQYCRNGRCSRIPPIMIFSRNMKNTTLLPNVTITRTTARDGKLTTFINGRFSPTTSNTTSRVT